MKRNEDGRSMIEMLAVLAIIGILSIGGIAGYSMAMDRYRAEQILNAALHLTASTTGGALTNATRKEQVSGAEIYLSSSSSTPGFVCVNWKNVSSKVKEIFNTRAVVYEKSGNCLSTSCCINFRNNKSLK